MFQLYVCHYTVSLLFPTLPKKHWGIQESVQAVCLSVHHCTFLHDGWIDFLHTGYHDQIPWATNTQNIKFGSVPN